MEFIELVFEANIYTLFFSIMFELKPYKIITQERVDTNFYLEITSSNFSFVSICLFVYICLSVSICICPFPFVSLSILFTNVYKSISCTSQILIYGKENNLVSPIIIFTNPSARAGYDTRSIFKRSLTKFEFRVFLLLD